MPDCLALGSAKFKNFPNPRKGIIFTLVPLCNFLPLIFPGERGLRSVNFPLDIFLYPPLGINGYTHFLLDAYQMHIQRFIFFALLNKKYIEIAFETIKVNVKACVLSPFESLFNIVF
jgi:hypothetical protein